VLFRNREVIAVDQDQAGKQGTRISKTGDQEIWLRELAGGEHVVALFNRGTDAVSMSIQWADLKLTKPPAHARDLWSHRDIQLTGPEYSTSVAGHGVVLLRVGR
jgi:alpha-galactosidase